jgi:hypothetical protein
MKYAILLAATAALTLSACKKSEEAGADATATAAASEAASPAASEAAATPPAAGNAAFTAGQPPSKEFMIGKWGEAGDCQLAIDFKADGTTDGPFGDWKLENGILTMADAPQKVAVVVVDANKMESRLDGKGDPKMMTRCP